MLVKLSLCLSRIRKALQYKKLVVHAFCIIILLKLNYKIKIAKKKFKQFLKKMMRKTTQIHHY